MTTKEIALKYGYNYKALQAWCYRRGLELKRITDWEVGEAIYLKTPKEIASEFNVNVKIVYYRLKKLGINPKVQQRGIK